MARARARPSPLGRLIAHFAGHRPRVWRASAYSVANKLFDIAPEILIGVAVDVVVMRESSMMARLGFADVWTQLLVLAGLTLVIWIAESLFEYLYAVEWRGLAQAVQHALRIECYGHVQTLDMAFFESRNTGGLVAVMNDDINQLERFLDGGANSLIQIATAFVAIGLAFFAIAPVLALLALAPTPFIVLGAWWFQTRAEPLYAEVRARAGNLADRLSNNLTGIATIKAYVAEARELAGLTADSLAYCAANRRAIRLGSAFIPVIRMAILAGFVLTLVVGGRMALDGALSVGLFSVLVFLTQRLLWPLTTLGQTVDLYQRAMASTRRVLDLLAVAAPEQRGGAPLASDGVLGRLRFEEVSFAYPDRGTVLDRVTLEIPAGSTAAFIGTTGSGKSTLAKLLLRFFEPATGRIRLDDRDIATLAVGELRQAIAYVAQDVFLFDGTVAENIAYACASASPEAIRAAARLAEVEDFIDSLPQGFETPVGERGQKLSGGQRQRISLARAILKDAPVLILDEATSAVDNETEAAIQRSLETVAVGRTTLVIAHRLTTIRHADQVFLVERGKITLQSPATVAELLGLVEAD